MPRYAMVEDGANIVVNVIMWDGDTETWQPPPGHTMVEDPDGKAGPGFSYVDGEFVPPPPPAPAPGDLTDLDRTILAAPNTLFGGPTLLEVFDVHATGN